MATDPRYSATVEVAADLRRSASLLPSALLITMMRLAHEYRDAHQIAEHAIMDPRPLGAKLTIEVMKLKPEEPVPSWLEFGGEFRDGWLVVIVVGSPTCAREVGIPVGDFRDEALAHAFAHFVAIYLADEKGMAHTLPASPFTATPPARPTTGSN